MNSRCVRAGLGAAYAGAGVLPSALHKPRLGIRPNMQSACITPVTGTCYRLNSSWGNASLSPTWQRSKSAVPESSLTGESRQSGRLPFLRRLSAAVLSANGNNPEKSSSHETDAKSESSNGNNKTSTADEKSEAGNDLLDSDGMPVTFAKASGRIVAIGDLHGDLTKTLQSLELAGVLGRDEMGRPVWVGGDTVVVQMGDVMDRGDCEIGIVMLLRQLHKMARKEGGAVYMLNGNHESLNICGDYRYVTAGAFVEAAMAAGLKNEQAEIWENQLRARVRLYSPGGPMAMELSKNPTVLMINDTVFAHGGLLPEHAKYGLKKINADVCRWMQGEKNPDGSPLTPPFLAMGDSNSIMWNRMYSRERFPSPYEKFHTCTTLTETLQKINAKRLVVGHTPQMEGANCECDQQIWRIDVGMSGGVLDAAAEVLEISGSGDNTVVRVVTAGSPVTAKG